jgi:enoyl-CoA hydratase/carnithine racemase
MAINGDALDHGLELALAGDLRIASAGARFGLTGLARGSFPWDGGTQRLPRLVGPAWARDMIFTGRIIDAAEALRLGLVNQVVEAEGLPQAAHELAERILAGGPIAARYAKESIHTGMELSLAQGLRLEADLNILLQSTADRAEGIESFLARRAPRFTGC